MAVTTHVYVTHWSEFSVTILVYITLNIEVTLAVTILVYVTLNIEVTLSVTIRYTLKRVLFLKAKICCP